MKRCCRDSTTHHALEKKRKQCHELMSFMVERTTETGQLRYYGDLYEPMAGCNYQVLYEVDMNKLHSLCSKAGLEIPNSPQWIRSPLKDLVLEEWRKHESNRNSNRPGGVSNPMFVGVRF